MQVRAIPQGGQNGPTSIGLRAIVRLLTVRRAARPQPGQQLSITIQNDIVQGPRGMMYPVHPAWNGPPPRRSVPDLEPAEPDERAPLVESRTARAMVRFTDRTIALCWIWAWQQRGHIWLVHIAWGDRGHIQDGWYRFDPEKVVPSKPVP